MIRLDESPAWVTIGDAPDRPGLAFQRVAGYRPPTWPDPEGPQQMHLDVAVADLEEGEKQVLAEGAQVLPGGGKTFRVYADPAGRMASACWPRVNPSRVQRVDLVVDGVELSG